LFGTSLGTVDSPPISLGLVQPLGWIDAIHFTYIDKQPNYPVIVAGIEGEKIQSYSLGISLEDFVAIASK
jgi:hypothetical protein